MHIIIFRQPVQLRLQALFLSSLLLTACSAPMEKTWDPLQGETTDKQARAGIDRNAAGMSPAMAALIQDADESIEQQQWGRALFILERALRVDAKQPEVWTRMAVTYLGKQEPQQALQMARRSNSYARSKPELQSYNWLLISRAYTALDQPQAAEKAAAKSQQLQ
ncbi:MAG: tetratricopeptide repeat protein [Gammaproteobacteria bacterium]|nr:tetratricopeptide repeat protein [Gammaproteobacteria bacterium]